MFEPYKAPTNICETAQIYVWNESGYEAMEVYVALPLNKLSIALLNQ